MKKITELDGYWKMPAIKKISRVMKLTCVLLMLSVTSVFASKSYSQTKLLNLKAEQATVKDVLAKIEDQSEFFFMYSGKVIDVDRQVSVKAENQKIDAVLDALFAETDVDYTIRDRIIVLTTPKVFNPESRIAFQQKSISGTVTDESGQPLPGVTVLIKGTTNGTVTNMDGNYSLNNIPEEATLVFSFMGMISQEIEVGTQTAINITMVVDAIGIEEVVAVGYGTLKRKDLTGSVSSIRGEEIVKLGDMNILQSLQGSVAGVQITNPTGRVGDSPEIIIRGKSSFEGNGPLFVVDGAIVDNVDFLNPNEVESMDVLKDASSIAIYGSRGSNGVVLITTKGAAGGQKGKTTLSFDSYYGIKTKARVPEFMDAKEYVDYSLGYWISRNIGGQTYERLDNFDDFFNAVFDPDAQARTNILAREAYVGKYDGYDWENLAVKNGMQSNNYFSINHNNNGSNYLIGLGYQKETGLVANEGIEQYNFNLNINQKFSEKLRVAASILSSFSDLERGHSKVMRDVYKTAPIVEPWLIDDNMQPIIGTLAPKPRAQKGKTAGTGLFNPILTLENTLDNTRRWNFIGNLSMEYAPSDWLTLRSTIAPSLRLERRGFYWGAMTEDNFNEGKPSSSKEHSESFKWTWDNQINVQKTFNSVHNLSMMFLQSSYLNRFEYSMLESSQQPFDRTYHNIGSGVRDTYDVGSGFSQEQLLSFAGRLNYNYTDKYLFTFTARADGTSKFVNDNRWGWFPSGALAWRASEESFLKDINAINNLKLRYSLGQSGNNSVNNYATMSVLTEKVLYDFDGKLYDGWYPSSLANTGLRWEKITESNLGLDFAFFNNRISGTFDWYNRVSDQLLVEQKLPLETGYDNIESNAASVRNRGVEIVLNTNNIETKSVRWTTSITFTKNNNEVLSVYGQEVDDVGNNRFIGQSLDVVYGYVFDGIWQEGQEEEAAVYNQKVGQAKVKDLKNEGDKIAITSDLDRTFLGSGNPTWEGGIVSYLQVKDFDFSFSLYTRQGVYAYSGFHESYAEVGWAGGNKIKMDYFVPSNKFIPSRPSNTIPMPRNEGEYWYGKGGVGLYKEMDYLKVRNISFGYSLPKRIINKAKINRLRFYVNVLNPFVFTKYDGFDPEWGDASKNDGRIGSITTQFGLNLNF